MSTRLDETPEVYIARLAEAFADAEVEFDGSHPYLRVGSEHSYRTLIVRTHLTKDFKWRLWVEVQNVTWDTGRKGHDISTVKRGWEMTPDGWVLKADEDPLRHVTVEWPMERFLGLAS